MIVVPIGREGSAVQRQPFATYGLIAVNVIAFVLLCLGSPEQERAAVVESWDHTITFVRERPNLRVPADVIDLMPRDIRQRPIPPGPSIFDWKTAKDQKTLDEMAADLRQRYESVAVVRLAYVPAVGSIKTLFTSMFLQAGLLHLLGNMFFLFATAPFIEEAYGRAVFLVLYLTGGVIATLTFGSLHPNSLVPLIGASGAIAAVMGAYLVRFTLSRLRFLFVPVIFVPFWNFRFSAPALVVLPLWLLEQIVSIPAEDDSGVAITAHIGGFAYGLLFAGVMRLIIREKKSVVRAAAAVNAAFTDPRVAAAAASFQRGDVETANREVNSILAEQPRNAEALQLALDLAMKAIDAKAIDGLATRLLEVYIASNDKARAAELIAKTRRTGHVRQFLDRAAAAMERWGDRRMQMELLDNLAERDRGTTNAVPTLMKLAMVRRSSGDASGARQILERALAEPHCSPEWRRRIENSMAAL
jgi:membrane associated rhomboid family serine protease